VSQCPAGVTLSATLPYTELDKYLGKMKVVIAAVSADLTVVDSQYSVQ